MSPTQECLHTAQYRYAVRRTRDGTITFGKLGTCKNVNVIATWCERCGAIEVDGAAHFHLPRARVMEDVA